MQDWASKFYHSGAWLACRRSYITSRIQVDGGLCERCHRRPGKIVHHRTYLTRRNVNDPAVTLNHRNLEYICQDCHNDEHLGNHAPLRYQLDAWGNPLPPSKP